MAGPPRAHPEPIPSGRSERRSASVVERLFRLLLALLVLAASASSFESTERVQAGSAVRERSTSQAVTGLRAAKVALSARGTPAGRNGSGPPIQFTPPPPPGRFLAPPARIVTTPRAPHQLVLPRRLNRPPYSGPPPPHRG